VWQEVQGQWFSSALWEGIMVTPGITLTHRTPLMSDDSSKCSAILLRVAIHKTTESTNRLSNKKKTNSVAFSLQANYTH
jgi:hypothetical protein